MADLTARGTRLGPLVRETPGRVLPREPYNDEVIPRVLGGAHPLWKLERMQSFSEPDVPSWVAAHEGDWRRALELIEGMRPGLRAMSQSLSRLRRTRIAERPPSPYLQWEMQVFLARTDAGETIRVLDAEAVAGVETDGPLPELLIIGPDVMYEILYDDAGGHMGGRRIEDRDVIRVCTEELAELFALGEDFRAYFAREIAPLPPPRTA
ncbi:hypothetical protein HNP84_002204 [Thermocatellispora tengchongensis]|uniref:DUF6879 domain-containing protein n=1 Tax=Thermocatellispora tengchongensis TaxID=1073253 RepID=A0A840NYB9_9ACTN|nr:DUF6879 family protein [Thermocatellispora tengchongensis]MBB5132488.1 hypothetical protein [Thermocatellispora tengchongensis]